MLDYNIALELLQKYGFSSTEHPYLFFNEPNVGLCILVDDENYGKLERRKIFTDINLYEEFLKKLAWMRDNADKYNVKMVLDNYELKEPKIMFLRDNRPMLIGEMFNIEAYDQRNEQKKLLDKKARMMYEIGDLLLVYDEMKIRQLNEMNLANSLRNELRRKYYDLQKEVNFYNKVDVELNLTLLAELITDSGVNEVSEVALKDRYNAAKSNPLEDNEVFELLEEVWDLLKQLESNERYYQTCVDVKELRNELALVQAKIDLMTELNEDPDAYRVDLMTRFRKINREFEENKTFVYEDYVKSKLNNIAKKYAAFSLLDKNSLADFLRESMENSDYDELMSRFMQNEVESSKIIKLPVNQVMADLNNKYATLSVPEQSILILSNSSYVRELMQMINLIPNYESLPVNEVMSYLNKFKKFSKVKSAFDVIKHRIELPENAPIKQSIFATINTTSFDGFVSSIISEMNRMKTVEQKMVLVSDVSLSSKEYENLDCETFIFLSNNVEELKSDYDYKKNILGSFVIKRGVPVLYSPYCLDFGNLDAKGRDAVIEPFQVRANSSFNLLVNRKNVMVSKDDFYVTVADFVSNPTISKDISVVSKLKYTGKYLFCKSTVLNSVAAARVQSILSITADNSAYNVTVDTFQETSQPIVQQLVGGSINDVNGSVSGVAQELPAQAVQQQVVEQQYVQQAVVQNVDNNGGN